METGKTPPVYIEVSEPLYRALVTHAKPGSDVARWLATARKSERMASGGRSRTLYVLRGSFLDARGLQTLAAIHVPTALHGIEAALRVAARKVIAPTAE